MNREKLFPAHIRDGDTQSVEEHCRNTAEYASAVLKEIGLGNTGYLAGLMHDMGKCKEKFKDYIIAASRGENVKKGTVNHTFAGVRYILNRFTCLEDYISTLTASLIAYASGAHHGQFDLVGENGRNGFDYRVNDNSIHYEESLENYFECVENEETIEQLFQKSVNEIQTVCEKIAQLVSTVEDDNQQQQEFDFCLALLARMILSAVIDGDRRDTAAFMLDIVFPEYDKQSIWEKSLCSVESKLNKLANDTEIQKAREIISDTCKETASREPGIYRLNVPTGGGKTLASLRYALAHALCYDKDRIILTSPLLSILDQNAQVVRDYIDNDSIILEHHSNVILDDSEEHFSERDILTETWDAPVIITTMVQLLNTMFSGKTRSIRRFHSLSGCVLVIDEVQTVPLKMLSMFNLCISFLATVCNSTIVLCSATQPCFEDAKHGMRGRISDIVPYDEELWKVFKRTKLIPQKCTQDQLPVIIQETLLKYDSLLVICNKKAEAEKLFRELSPSIKNCFHLSASMCMQHRKDTLSNIKDALNQQNDAATNNEKVLCISTQVIEAGVDISFSSVIRFAAGMDSAVQAAGRCNRNGESNQPLPVYLAYCQDETLSFLPEIQKEKDATSILLSSFDEHPEKYHCDLLSPEAIKDYYHALYRRLPDGYQDYCSNQGMNLFDLLSCNEKFIPDNYQNPYLMNQAFKTAGDLFEVFEQCTYDVLVPYGQGDDLIKELNGKRASYDFQYRKTLLQKLKPYSVSLFQWQKKQLEEQNGLYTVCDGCVLVLAEQFYDKDIGLITQPGTSSFLEV